jgi:hypothetical protein
MDMLYVTVQFVGVKSEFCVRGSVCSEYLAQFEN